MPDSISIDSQYLLYQLLLVRRRLQEHMSQQGLIATADLWPLLALVENALDAHDSMWEKIKNGTYYGT